MTFSKSIYFKMLHMSCMLSHIGEEVSTLTYEELSQATKGKTSVRSPQSKDIKSIGLTVHTVN